jgi:N-glycosylase/DNA lyase
LGGYSLDYRDVQKDSRGVAVTGLRRFSLDEILGCGQCFRWDMREPGRWRGVARGLAREIEQEGESLKIIGADIAEFHEVWHGYFDFGRDYGELCAKLSKDPAMRRAVEFTPGMRVLRQEPWEALCTFIISQNNNIKRIKGIVARLCELFGEEIEGGHAFPAPEKLAALDEKALEPLRCGFRAGYILDAARKVSSGETDLGRIAALNAEEAALELQKIRGVGPKVAACALLYGFARADTIPVDVWIKRALAEFYPKGMPPELKEIQGLGQQYLFHYMRNR